MSGEKVQFLNHLERLAKGRQQDMYSVALAMAGKESEPLHAQARDLIDACCLLWPRPKPAAGDAASEA